MSDLIMHDTITRHGATFRICLFQDLDARPEEYECYTPADVQGWRESVTVCGCCSVGTSR